MKICGKIVFNKNNSEELELHEEFVSGIQMLIELAKMRSTDIKDLIEQEDVKCDFNKIETDNEIEYDYYLEDAEELDFIDLVKGYVS